LKAFVLIAMSAAVFGCGVTAAAVLAATAPALPSADTTTVTVTSSTTVTVVSTRTATVTVTTTPPPLSPGRTVLLARRTKTTACRLERSVGQLALADDLPARVDRE
jgi:hypothetical protein